MDCCAYGVNRDRNPKPIMMATVATHLLIVPSILIHIFKNPKAIQKD